MRSVVRRSTIKFSRMGLGRRKLHRWRNAVGRHSKIRKNRFGYTKSPRIGFKSDKRESGKINDKIPMLITNMADLSKAKKENILIIARVLGARKRVEIIKKANDAGLEMLNVKSGDKHGSK